jgi:transposase
MKPNYPSDINEKQFERIRPILVGARKRTRPRTVDLHHVFCGVLYVLKSGCQWRMLPSDFPKWRTCYEYFRKWGEERDGQISLLEEALKKCGWRGATKPWSERTDTFLHR